MTEAVAHRLFGLDISSEIPLPGPASSGPADIFIRRGTVTAQGEVTGDLTTRGRLLTGEDLWSAWARPNGHLLRAHRVCDFAISTDTRSVTVNPFPDTDDDMVALIIVGTMLTYLLALRGRPVLHASAVASHGRAVAIAGPSGSGKSTTAALLCAAGAQVMTDDLVAWRITDNGVVVDAGPPSLRLRSGARHLAGAGGWPPRTTPDDRVAVTPAASEQAAPLAGVLLTKPVTADSPVTIDPLSPVAAVPQLLRNVRGPHPVDSTRRREQLEVCAALAERVPAAVVTLPIVDGVDQSISGALHQAVSRFLGLGG